jgi:hypothetical protein
MAEGESEVYFIVNRLVPWRGQDGKQPHWDDKHCEWGTPYVVQADHEHTFAHTGDTVWLESLRLCEVC